MPINFPQQKNKLKNTLKKNEKTNPPPPVVGQQIANWYDVMIKTGQDAAYGNTILTGNLPTLLTQLQSALSAGQLPLFQQAINTGIIAYWTGATLQPAVPPPGSIQVVNNVIVNPGAINYTASPINSSLDLFINELVTAIQAHLTTVSGVTTSLTPQPSGPPVPVPYPFQGYV